MRQRTWSGLVALALAAALEPGCASKEPRENASVVATASATSSAGTGAENLYALPEMRDARAHRERGSRLMESAYKAQDPILRKSDFDIAWKEFRSAEEAYHDALTKSPTRFRPVIENEINQVAQYMRQIQRDREPPKVD